MISFKEFLHINETYVRTFYHKNPALLKYKERWNKKQRTQKAEKQSYQYLLFYELFKLDKCLYSY